MRLLVVLIPLVISVSVSCAFDCDKFLECADSTVDYIAEVGSARMVQVKRKVVVDTVVVIVVVSVTPIVLLLLLLYYTYYHYSC